MRSLIIWYNIVDENNILGGVEYYLFHLIKILKKNNIKIDFLYLNENKIWTIKKNEKNCTVNLKKFCIRKWIIKKFNFKKNDNFLKNIFIKNYEHKLLNNFLKKEIKNKNYAYIINNIPLFFSKKIRKHNSFIFVQHTDALLYEKYFYANYLKNKKFNLFKNFCYKINNFCLLIDKNCLKKYKNVVFYSDNVAYKSINKNLFVGSVPVDNFLINKTPKILISEKNNNSILYFGRFDNESKNLELLTNISKEGNFNIDLFGFGDYEIELKKNSFFHLKKKISTIDEKINILSKYDIFLLTSNFEGLSIGSIELLSMGVIGIIRNSFLEAKNLIPKKYHDFLLVKSNAKVNEYINKINHIKNIPENLKSKIRIDLINHIKNNYSIKIFENNWNEILKKINDRI